MIPLEFMRGEEVAVLGLGRTGLAAARALAASGAGVRVWDDGAAARQRAAADRLSVAEPDTRAWRAASTLVLSPGIPHGFPTPHPAVVRARADGWSIVGDMELFARATTEARRIGVTGTNGKSTTTALIGHLLAAAGKRVAVGGNIGRAVLDLDVLGSGGIYVIELSSFQLDLVVSAAFEVAVLINVSPDHLDRHDGFKAYVTAKARIFRNPTAHAAAVVGVDDEPSRQQLERLRAEGRRRLIPISCERPLSGGVHAVDGILFDSVDGPSRRLADLKSIPTLPGRHNHQNAAAAVAACRSLGVDAGALADALAAFSGLPHRQERIAAIDGVTYVNDSKATNPDAARRALACYDDIYWIAGGRPKEAGIDLPPDLRRRLRRAFLIGEAAEAFARSLSPDVPTTLSHTLEHAVNAAQAVAGDTRGAVVLLSPACASYDQFSDFEARGAAFRDLVDGLPGRREV